MWNRFSLLPHVVIYIGERLCHTSGNGIEGGALFGELIVAYLFLAGAGAGGVAAASLADLLLVRESFGVSVLPDFAEKRPAERLVAGALALSCGALALGAGCLAADLGRADRVLSLFLAPPVTLMNLGAWAVALLTAVAAALALARFLYVPWLHRCAMVVAEIVACGLAVVVAVYAGLLLQTLSGVRLWSSPWVPALFALSAASCGCALLMAGALFAEGDEGVRKVAQAAARADAVVIVVEVAAAAGFLAFVAGSDHAGVRVSEASLLCGPAALPWWVGFMACGLAAPLAVEVGCLVRERWRSRSGVGRDARAYPIGVPVSEPRAYPAAALALAGALVLVGAVGLRAAVVEAGAQRPLELQEVEASASVPSENEAAAGLLSTPSEKDGGQDGAAPEREDVTLWSN